MGCEAPVTLNDKSELQGKGVEAIVFSLIALR